MLGMIRTSNKKSSGDNTWEHCTKVNPENKQHVQCNYSAMAQWDGITQMKHHFELSKYDDNVFVTLNWMDGDTGEENNDISLHSGKGNSIQLCKSHWLRLLTGSKLGGKSMYKIYSSKT